MNELLHINWQLVKKREEDLVDLMNLLKFEQSIIEFMNSMNEGLQGA